MKPVLFVLLMAGSLYSCTVDSRTSAPALPAATPLATAETTRKPITLALVQEPDSFWNTQDLSPLLASRQPDGEAPLNGFFGTDRYRIEVFFSTVRKDPKQAGRYLLNGKTRYKKQITAFEGELVLDSLYTLTDPEFQADLNPDIRQLFAAAGTFALRESAAGVFSGRFGITLARRKNGRLQTWPGGPGAPDEGAGFVFRGEWRKASTGKPFLLAQDFRVIGDQVLTHFAFPDRSRGINPAYRRLGWDTLMDGEEWWNEAAD